MFYQKHSGDLVGEDGFARVRAGHGPENMPPACFLGRPFRIHFPKEKSEPRHKAYLGFWWGKVDSNHRSDHATDLQSAPIGHSGIPPYTPYKILELVDGLEPPTC